MSRSGAFGRRLRWTVLLGAAGLAGLLPGCREPRSAGSSASAASPVPVRAAYCAVKTLRPSVETFGTIVQESKVDLYPQIEGTIERIAVEEGQRVRAGQALVFLSRRDLLLARERVEAERASRQARVLLAQEKLAEGRRAVEARILEVSKAEAEQGRRQAEYDSILQVYANKKRLHEAGGVASGELETLRTRVLTAQLELTRAQKELEIRRIGLRDADILSAGLAVPEQERDRRGTLVRINTGMLNAELAVAQADLSASNTEVRRIAMMVEEATISSPIEGVVGVRYVEEGEKAGPDTRLLTVFKTETVYAQVQIGEGDLRALRIGQEAEVYFDEADTAQGEAGVAGRIALISPYIDPNTRTARVRVRLDNASGRYVPGMFVRLRLFIGDPVERVVVPAGAVLTDPLGVKGDATGARRGEPGGGKARSAVVFVLRDRRAFRREVRLAPRQGQWEVILAGLREGETVVLDPRRDLADGTEVEPRW